MQMPFYQCLLICFFCLSDITEWYLGFTASTLMILLSYPVNKLREKILCLSLLYGPALCLYELCSLPFIPIPKAVSVFLDGPD